MNRASVHYARRGRRLFIPAREVSQYTTVENAIQMLKPQNSIAQERRNGVPGCEEADGAFLNLSGFYPVLWVAAALVALVFVTCNLLMGDLNQDEGWYLYAARLVTEGRLPYIDFATTQPVMPFVYAVAQPLVDHWGVAGGRFFTVVLGFLSCLFAAWLAAMLAPARQKRAAAFIVFSIIAINVYQSYFFTAVKTYSLRGIAACLRICSIGACGKGQGRAGGGCFRCFAGLGGWNQDFGAGHSSHCRYLSAFRHATPARILVLRRRRTDMRCNIRSIRAESA